VRYLTSLHVAQRLAPGDSQFLLVKFPKVQFAEVTISSGARWESLEFSTLVTSSAKDLPVEFLRSPAISPLHEATTAQFPDFSESSSNSTLDIPWISEDERSQGQSKGSSLTSPEVSPIPRGKGLILVQSSRTTTASSQEVPQYDIYDSSLDF